MHKLPFLSALFLLLFGLAFAYKLDDIMHFIVDVGYTTAAYLFYSAVGIFITAVIGFGTWLILSYRIKQRTLSQNQQYRDKLIDKYNLIVLEDGAVLNKVGEVVYNNTTAILSRATVPVVVEAEQI